MRLLGVEDVDGLEAQHLSTPKAIRHLPEILTFISLDQHTYS